MSTYKYPDGREYTPTTETVTPRKPRERKERRISAPGENSQFAVRKPDRSSLLRVLSAIYEQSGWQTEFIKYPCQCQDWTNKGANAVCVWRGPEHRIWCVCQVSTMQREQMEREAAA
jgi:hypothetical protein